VVKILANPVLLRSMVILFCSAFAFLMGLIFIRLLRKSIRAEAEIETKAPCFETMPMHVYNTVIQQLKQQQEELQRLSRVEQQRARASESFSQAVLANLPCGVLVLGSNGLVKSGNPAAKQILGFASVTGMSVQDIFGSGSGETGAESHEGMEDQPGQETEAESIRMADEVDAVLHEGGNRRELDVEYETPEGGRKFLSVTISPVRSPEGNLLGAACVVNDTTDLHEIEQPKRDSAQGVAAGAS
jgi:PAS domain-containing protein